MENKTDVKKAVKLIKEAINLHTGHMDSDNPTSKASEEKEMGLLKGVLKSLTGGGAKK